MAQLINKERLEATIDGLEGLEESQKHRIKDRWLAYVIWWDARARKNKWKYFTLRSTVVIGGVIVPALIGSAAMPSLLDINKTHVQIVQWIAFVLSLIVGVAAALEGLFRYGEIWREKRAAGEILKCEGFRYFMLVGKYRGKTHKDAYPDFAAEVEDMIEREIKDYILVNRPKESQPDHDGLKKAG